MPCHHNLEAYLYAYIDGAGIGSDAKGPLFRTIGRKTRQLSRNPLHQANHNSTRTTQLYDRRSDELTLDEVERVLI